MNWKRIPPISFIFLPSSLAMDDAARLSVYDPTDDFNLEEQQESKPRISAPPENEYGFQRLPCLLNILTLVTFSHIYSSLSLPLYLSLSLSLLHFSYLALAWRNGILKGNIVADAFVVVVLNQQLEWRKLVVRNEKPPNLIRNDLWWKIVGRIESGKQGREVGKEDIIRRRCWWAPSSIPNCWDRIIERGGGGEHRRGATLTLKCFTPRGERKEMLKSPVWRGLSRRRKDPTFSPPKIFVDSSRSIFPWNHLNERKDLNLKAAQ